MFCRHTEAMIISNICSGAIQSFMAVRRRPTDFGPAGAIRAPAGTTVDFGGTAHDWTAEFIDTGPGQWLMRYAREYGFVMSYPQGTEKITGYAFEPWHYRFIGIEVAAEWFALRAGPW